MSRVTAAPAATREAREVLADLLDRPRYEILPFGSIVEDVLAHVPTGARVTVTASPRKGLQPTLEISERLTREGYTVVPHLSARLVRDRAQLGEVVHRLHEAGVRELFVPAGDAEEPAGEFHGAADLLSAMGELRERFSEIGITGYPESHHAISDEETIAAMFEKAPMATCIVSQVCFDSDAIVDWVRAVRARGTELPMWIGLPGCVDYAKLVRISLKIGLGESVRFLGHHRSWMRRLMTRSFRPNGLIRGIEPLFVEPAAGLLGFHLYTFNEVQRTEAWRQSMLVRLRG